jgi:hypothetical protein
VELPREAVAELIASDDLPCEEAAVVAAVRAWFDHDAAGRAGALKELVPLIRWPLLPVAVRVRARDCDGVGAARRRRGVAGAATAARAVAAALVASQTCETLLRLRGCCGEGDEVPTRLVEGRIDRVQAAGDALAAASSWRRQW